MSLSGKMDARTMQQTLAEADKFISEHPEIAKSFPVRPEEPLPQDCCGCSCSPCVFDIFRHDTYSWARECLVGAGLLPKEESEQRNNDMENLHILSRNEFRKFKLVSIERVSEDSNIYRFELPEPGAQLALPIGSHIVLRGKNKRGRIITRQYTPISEQDARSFFDILVKLYQYGQMSHFWRQLSINQYCEFMGPYQKFSYRRNQFSKIFMLAGGTGIAPMAQIIQAVLKDEQEETRIRLLYCCKTYDDILLKHRIDDWSRYWNFTVKFILSQEKNVEMRKYKEEICCGKRLDQELLRTELCPYIGDICQGTDDDNSTPVFRILICGTKSFDKDMINFIKKIFGRDKVENFCFRF